VSIGTTGGKDCVEPMLHTICIIFEVFLINKYLYMPQIAYINIELFLCIIYICHGQYMYIFIFFLDNIYYNRIMYDVYMKKVTSDNICEI